MNKRLTLTLLSTAGSTAQAGGVDRLDVEPCINRWIEE
jgi:hypothetical protein